ncbi:hypothetical protein Xszus_03518 [Xenorhabdus szentirmaii]|nr:hypothetical protein Xszus_03518 [Xenorhabdus szentirmaii]
MPVAKCRTTFLDITLFTIFYWIFLAHQNQEKKILGNRIILIDFSFSMTTKPHRYCILKFLLAFPRDPISHVKQIFPFYINWLMFSPRSVLDPKTEIP